LRFHQSGIHGLGYCGIIAHSGQEVSHFREEGCTIWKTHITINDEGSTFISGMDLKGILRKMGMGIMQPQGTTGEIETEARQTDLLPRNLRLESTLET
jgi:hypothetical protein